MFVVSFLALCPPQLSFELMNGHVNAPVGILTGFGADKDLAVLGPGNYLDGRTAARAAVYNHFNPVDAVVVLGKLGSLLLCMASDSFGYFDVFARNCEKQDYSP